MQMLPHMRFILLAHVNIARMRATWTSYECSNWVFFWSLIYLLTHDCTVPLSKHAHVCHYIVKAMWLRCYSQRDNHAVRVIWAFTNCYLGSVLLYYFFQCLVCLVIIFSNKLFLRKLCLTHRIVAFNISFLTLWLLIIAISEKYLFI